MAEGTTYDIDIHAQAIGAEATDAQITGLADALAAAEAVATPFDAAIAAAEARLASAADASADAAAALQAAEKEFGGLERASTRAAKAVERAAAKGKDTSKLKAAADSAAAAVQKQAAAVDALRAKSDAAAASERKLSSALGKLRNAAKAAARETDDMSGRMGEAKTQALELVAQQHPMLGQFNELAKNLGPGALKMLAFAAAAALVAAAFVGMTIAIGAGVVAMLKFAVANDKVAKARIDRIAKDTKESIKGLFSGVNTVPLLNAVERLSKVFDETSTTGRVLKKLIETLLNPIIRAVEYAAPLLKEMFKGAVYGALRLAIAGAKVRIAILKAIPKEAREKIDELITGAEGLGLAFSAGEAIMYAVAAVIGAIVLAAAALGVVIIAAGAALYAFVQAFVRLYQVGATIVKAIADWQKALGDWVKDAPQAAADFIRGLVEGIKNGAGAVAQAVKTMAKDAVTSMKQALGIKSPSKVMMQIGTHMTEGLTGALDEGAGDVRSSLERMTSPVDELGGGGASASVSRGGDTYHVTIQAPSGDAEDILATFKRWLTGELEATAVQLGGGQTPQGAT